MLRKHITALVAGTALIAASLTAVPASAGSRGDKLLGLALGVGALAIIANEAKASRNAPAPVYSDRTYDRYDRYDNRDGRYAPRWRHARVYEVPKTCLYKHWTRHGWETFASKSCVNRYAAKHHIKRRDILPRYRDERGRIVWLDTNRNWLR